MSSYCSLSGMNRLLLSQSPSLGPSIPHALLWAWTYWTDEQQGWFCRQPIKGQMEHLGPVASATAKWWSSRFCWTMVLARDRNRSTFLHHQQWLWRISSMDGALGWMGMGRKPASSTSQGVSCMFHQEAPVTSLMRIRARLIELLVGNDIGADARFSDFG